MKFLKKIINNIQKSFKKASGWFKLVLLLIVILLAAVIVNRNMPEVEGFQQE